MMCRLILILLSSCISLAAQATLDQLFDQRIATTLQPVSLYQDSSFSARVHTTFEEGEIVEVIGETNQEHEDDSQNQRFKWFQVKNNTGQVGWIFGDALAVIVPEQRLDDELEAIHKQKVSFNHGFENAVIWMAAIEGHDNFNRNNFLNPVYRETYLVITNQKRRSVFVRCAGSSTQGSNSVHALELKDISGDNIPEIVLLTKSQTVGSPVENRELQIFSFQAGTLSNVFEERLTLTYADDQPSPALYKYIDIEPSYIRVAYLTYVKPEQYRLPYPPTSNHPQQSRCLEYVTATYTWNDFQKRFITLYPESHAPPKVAVNQSTIHLLDQPKKGAKRVGSAVRGEQLRVIQHYETFVKDGSTKKVVPYLFVLLSDGRQGYIKANQVKFIDLEHRDLLNQYYQQAPISRVDWRSREQFVRTP